MADVKTRYYRTNIAGLSFVVGAPQGNEVAPETVRFKQYQEMWQGDEIRVGYLATDDIRAQRIAKADINVEEIEEEAFNQATDPDVNPKVRQLSHI